MTDAERKEAVRKFFNKWNGKGNEDQDCQTYWIEFLTNVVGVKDATDRIVFEKKVIVEGHTKKIDVYIPETHVLIEQKSYGKALDKKIINSGDIELTPYEQAKRYNDNLPYEEKAKWIITSNFDEIWIYDMSATVPKPEKFVLAQLPLIFSKFEFLINKEQQELSQEMEISIKAGEFVGLIYDALSKEYHNPESEESQKSLNVLCVRLVFCLYAEDAHVFGTNGHMFRDYLNAFATKDMRKALKELFKILNTPENERDSYDTSDLMKFPYVNGGLFADENIEIPNFTDEIRDILLSKASDGFDWSEISPTIFGAVFESTLNPETRRSGGMHYTSIENIHKVIDPLFLDDLKEELKVIREIQVVNTKKKKLEAFQDKLASLTWLDPAAGSGNFLTETFLSIRKLENQTIRGILDCKKGSVEGQIILGDVTNPIKVKINQFYGIEINDFAVTVAKTALWIAESQMIKETEGIIHQKIDFLPLKTKANIVEGNALRIKWNDVLPAEKCSFIMGNPPFIGHQWRTDKQVNDMKVAFYDLKNHGKLDYVCSWYNVAADYIGNKDITVAFVSTNSICQGESAPILWEHLLSKGIEIQFAYKTFIWDSEASSKAHVHCVIIGFKKGHSGKRKMLFENSDSFSYVDNINGYLIAAPDIYIKSRSFCLYNNLPSMFKGSQPTDGNHLILEPEEYESFEKNYPNDLDLVRPYMGSYEFINNKKRYCLWLKDIEPSRYIHNSFIMKRLSLVKESRLKSATESVIAAADYPYLFTQIRQPNCDYLAFPAMSSSRRLYIPIGYVSRDVIASNQLYVVPNASKYLFGVLTSNVHMAWMKVVCGRLKSDFRYAPAIYNNFPFPKPTKIQKDKIEETAQKILDMRMHFPNSSLADLYDPLTMPIELFKAHKENDRAVMQAYGFSVGDMSEDDCVAELMKMYQELTYKK